MARKGKMVWQKYNCNACHQIYGLGGYLGPDLTNVTSIRNTKQLTAFIKSGTKSMPVLNLTDTEIECLIEFLKNVNSTGKSDPRTFQIQKNGTIHQ
ncbi:MAG: cytochrome c [Bacteroidia bacterium]|nr:cytochrome c [Bacteroidia bacterium]